MHHIKQKTEGESNTWLLMTYLHRPDSVSGLKRQVLREALQREDVVKSEAHVAEQALARFNVHALAHVERQRHAHGGGRGHVSALSRMSAYAFVVARESALVLHVVGGYVGAEAAFVHAPGGAGPRV